MRAQITWGFCTRNLLLTAADAVEFFVVVDRVQQVRQGVLESGCGHDAGASDFWWRRRFFFVVECRLGKIVGEFATLGRVVLSDLVWIPGLGGGVVVHRSDFGGVAIVRNGSSVAQGMLVGSLLFLLVAR